MPLCVEPKFTIVSKNKLEQCGYKRCSKKKKNENDLDMDAIHRRQEYKFCY